MLVVTDYNSIVPYLRGLPTVCVKTPVCRMVGFANLVPKEEGEKEKEKKKQQQQQQPLTVIVRLSFLSASAF